MSTADAPLPDDRPSTPDEGELPIRVGISACLTGEEVRFDAGHKRDNYIMGTLARYFELVPYCPEVAIGLGTPRPPIRLVGSPEAPRARGTRDPALDVTEALDTYGLAVGEASGDLSGYILKRGSPSCGMERVKVYLENGHPGGQGRGVYARALMDAQPLLPVEEEGRLGDPVLRENFIERVLVYHRWQSLARNGLTADAVVRFHTDHKLLVMAHSQEAYRRLGRMVADAGRRELPELAAEYIAALMAALGRRVKRGQHVNVLLHLLGYLKSHLDAGDKAELLETFEAYRHGRLPLIVPITLLKHHFRRHPEPYVERQVYLSPHPAELMLRNWL